jgi:hypothetical protein
MVLKKIKVTYMTEKKVVGRNIAIVLGVICIFLAVCLLGAISNYTSIINERDNTISSLNSQITNMQNQLNSLNVTYIWLKHHSFTYYTVGNDINISNVGIWKNPWGWQDWTINGTLTNIGDEPIKTIYVYAIFVNPDGTREFSPYRYAIINDLYMGETATFSINTEVYKESQTVEIFLVY